MFETARLVETLDEPRDDADIELLVLRLLVAAESDVEPRPPLEFVAGALPRELANVLEFVLPRAVVAEFVEPLRPKFAEGGGQNRNGNWGGWNNGWRCRERRRTFRRLRGRRQKERCHESCRHLRHRRG